MEDIELASLEHRDDLDLELIEDDVIESVSNCRVSGDESGGEYPFCYTPERLVRAREYRILTPSLKYFFEVVAENQAVSTFRDSRPKSPKFRRKLADLIDSSQIGASQLEALLDSTAPEIRVPLSIRRSRRHRDRHLHQELGAEVSHSKDLLEIANRESPIRCETPEPASSNSSTCGCLCNSLEDREKSSRSVDDTSGIQSNTWSESGSGCQTPVCATIHGYQNCIGQGQFSSTSSTHDYLTRLALSIGESCSDSLKESRAPEEEFDDLRLRVEQLQKRSRHMYRDIGLLRLDFQCEERKLDNLHNETSRLHRDINELRYLDDLLSLLRGEMARISRRNWPFVIGHDSYDHEEINLVV